MPSSFAGLWEIDPTIVFLNHGSFGACPRGVLEFQRHLQKRIEKQPLLVLDRELEPLLDRARAEIATFVGAQADDLAFLPNASTGINTILASLRLSAGDEIVFTSHEYNATRNAVLFHAERMGARPVGVDLPLPIEESRQVVEAVLGAVTPRTRLVVVDHLTSATALVLPIEKIVSGCRERGIDVLIDGAHGPGAVPLDLDRLGAAYYCGNLHKWACAPKGAGFMHVRRDRQSGIRPLVISHGANSRRTDRSRFRLEFDWLGTDDPTPFLAAAEAVRYLGTLLPGGWDELRARNTAMSRKARQLLIDRCGWRPLCPETMLGPMAAVRLEDGAGQAPLPPRFADALQTRLWEEHAIEVMISHFPAWPSRVLRVSCQLYNSDADYERLCLVAGSADVAGSGQTAHF